MDNLAMEITGQHIVPEIKNKVYIPTLSSH